MKRRAPAKGCARPGDAVTRQIVCRFDVDTFDEIRQRAETAGTSFNQQVQLLVEWGLIETRHTAAQRPAR